MGKEDKDDRLNDVLIFPLIKKYKNIKFDPDNICKEDIDILSRHYVLQLKEHFKNHGFNIDNSFNKDLSFTYEAIKSMLLRSVNKHHKLQEFVDEIQGKLKETE